MRRGGAFLCDTAHDGGAAELTVSFGTAGQVPLFGDFDGDGDDDPCVRRGRTFLCDVTRDGVRDFVRSVDARPGDRPLMGDLFGRNSDDFCVARGTALLCADPGGLLVPVRLTARQGDRILLGNVDGF